MLPVSANKYNTINRTYLSTVFCARCDFTRCVFCLYTVQLFVQLHLRSLKGWPPPPPLKPSVPHALAKTWQHFSVELKVPVQACSVAGGAKKVLKSYTT